MCGSAAIIDGTARPTYGNRADGKFRRANMRFGWLPDGSIEMAGMCSWKAGGSSQRANTGSKTKAVTGIKVAAFTFWIEGQMP